MPPLNARQQVLVAAAQAQARERLRAGKAEEQARQWPITGNVQGYDPETGDWLVSTPDGGTLRTQSLTNAAPTGPVPVQRFQGSQLSTFSAPPTQADLAWLLSEIDASAIALFETFKVGAIPGQIDKPETGKTYTLLNHAPFRLQLKQFTETGNSTGVLSPVLGTDEEPTILEVGDSLELSFSQTDGAVYTFVVMFVRL